MSSDREPTLDVFFSYSHHDEELRNALENHLTLLKRKGAIRTWHDRRIGAGREWQGEIDQHLESADLILLLISPDFIASDYCFDREMTRALERHAAGQARVIPILLRPVDWRTARFAKLRSLPADDRPITAWSDRDSAFADVTRDIRKVIVELRQDAGAPPTVGGGPERAGTGPEQTDTPRLAWRRHALAVAMVAVAMVAVAMIAVAVATFLAIGPGTESEPSAADLERIFTDQKTNTEIVGRLALRLVDMQLAVGNELAVDRQVRFDHSFSSGDYFRFEVTSSRDGWLYVFHRPLDGPLHLLWPERGETRTNVVRAYQPLIIPPGEAAFLFTDEIGEEYFYVALASAPNAKAPTALDPKQREDRVESFIARGLHGSMVSNRRRRVVVARPGEGKHVYFTATDSSDAAVEFRLQHEE